MTDNAEKAKQKEIKSATQTVISTVLIVVMLLAVIALVGFFIATNIGSWLQP